VLWRCVRVVILDQSSISLLIADFVVARDICCITPHFALLFGRLIDTAQWELEGTDSASSSKPSPKARPPAIAPENLTSKLEPVPTSLTIDLCLIALHLT
jgi:hypothetical protein